MEESRGQRSPDIPAGHGKSPGFAALVSVALGSALVAGLTMYLVMKPAPADTAAPELPSARPSTSALTPTSLAEDPTVLGTPSPEPAAVVSPLVSTSTTPGSLVEPTSSSPETTATSPVPVETIDNLAWPELEDGWIAVNDGFSSIGRLAELGNSPAGFKEFAAGFVGPDEYGCTVEIWVYAMHPEGFVIGDEGYTDCGGGAQVIWSDQGGQWDTLFATQDGFDCYELAASGLPENSGEVECWADGQFWWY